MMITIIYHRGNHWVNFYRYIQYNIIIIINYRIQLHNVISYILLPINNFKFITNNMTT